MKILAVRIGRLGDIVMVLPALLHLRQQYPNAQLTILTSLDGLRLLSQIEALKGADIWTFRHTYFARMKDTMRFKSKLKQQKFDVAYCFERKKRIIDLLPKTTHILPASETMTHYSLRCLALVSAPKILPGGAYINLPASLNASMQQLLEQEGITKQTVLVGFHPTYSGYNKLFKKHEHPHRLWPVDAFVRLANLLTDYAKQKNIDIKIVMDVLPEEREIANQIVNKSLGNVRLLSVTKGFMQYLSFLNQLSVLVVANTGVMHLAAALNIPTVALFSNLLPEDCGPFMDALRCSVIRAENYVGDEKGLARIPPEDVKTEILSLCNLA